VADPALPKTHHELVHHQEFCHLVRIPGYLYLTGAIIWSCLIAVYRISYIKFNRFMINTNEQVSALEKKFLF
jgi:hypothetical protein